MLVSADLLQNLPLLMTLPKVTLEHIARHSRVQFFAKREAVLEKGNTSHDMCFLVDGLLQGIDFTSDGREVGIYFVQPGDYFGEVALIDSGAQPEFVTSVSRSRVVFIPKDLIKPILFGAPKLAEILCVRLSARLREMAVQRRILGLSSPIQKVCLQLELMLERQSSPKLLLNAPTHQELAIMVNVSRETVTRVFQMLQGRGVVERDGNDLRIEDAKFLADVASGVKDPSKI